MGSPAFSVLFAFGKRIWGFASSWRDGLALHFTLQDGGGKAPPNLFVYTPCLHGPGRAWRGALSFVPVMIAAEDGSE